MRHKSTRRGTEWSAPMDEKRISGEKREVEGLPTEWNHNLLTGGWRAGKVRSKGGYDSISLVTTGNDYSPSRAPAPRRHRNQSCAVATWPCRLTLNERFHLKTLPALSRAPTTTRTARMTNARGGLSVGTSQM